MLICSNQPLALIQALELIALYYGHALTTGGPLIEMFERQSKYGEYRSV